MGYLDDKKVIMIHGLASKPHEDKLHSLWTKALLENIKVEDSGLYDDLNAKKDTIFSHAYWANEIPAHIEDEKEYVEKLEKRVDEVIAERKKHKDGFHTSFGEKFKSFFKDKALDVVDVFTTALTIKDNIARENLEEIKFYSNDQYISDKIRKNLEDELKQAWDENKKVVLISHSMGTFISYDVLWRFTHKNIEGYKEYNKKQVDIFITMGSPLGDNIIQDIMFCKEYKDNEGSLAERYYPKNIKYWHNYSCLGDVVCHDSTLKDDYHKEMRKLGLFENDTKYNAIDYTKLYNPFKKVNKAEDDEDKNNPHKSYGYLVQPKLAKWLKAFFNDKLDSCKE